jgi:Fuc2NAc and GlcNAc transferase
MSLGLIWIAMAVTSAVSTGWMRQFALRRQLLDVPDHRSSHTRVTPRGGGLAFVLVFLLAITGFAVFGRVPPGWAVAFVGAGGAVAWVGFMDDHGHVSARIRLLVHVAATVWALVWLGGPPTVQFGTVAWPAGALAWIFWVPFLVWLLNLYNFMDGIDGIAGVEALTVLAGATLISFQGLDPDSLIPMQALMASVFGFVVWNWPPARIFMGDVGSGFIGIAFGIIILASAREASLTVWSWMILLGVFLVDATTTLVVRLLSGQRWWEPHRSHAYQVASRRWGGHRPVTVGVAAVNLGWLLPMAWWATADPESAWWVCLAALVPLLILAFRLDAGRPEYGVE